MDTKFWIVSRTLMLGEYEKTNDTVVQADTRVEAERKALEGECHGSIDDGSARYDKGTMWDMHDEMAYSIRDCKLIESQEHLDILRRYL